MSLVALGKAYELTFIRDGQSTPETVSFPGWWWAWSGTPTGGSILLVKPLSIIATPRGTSRDMHATFHGETPDRGMDVKAPDIKEAKRAGLVISFAYDARGMPSTKADKPYRHHFGAETHDDKPPFPEKDLPILGGCPGGGIVIKRRAGNGFRLADWVIG